MLTSNKPLNVDVYYSNLNTYSFFVKSKIREDLINHTNSNKFLFLDLLFSYFFSKKYIYNNNSLVFRSYFRVLQTKQGFYFNFSKLLNSNSFLDQLKISLNSG